MSNKKSSLHRRQNKHQEHMTTPVDSTTNALMSDSTYGTTNAQTAPTSSTYAVDVDKSKFSARKITSIAGYAAAMLCFYAFYFIPATYDKQSFLIRPLISYNLKTTNDTDSLPTFDTLSFLILFAWTQHYIKRVLEVFLVHTYKSALPYALFQEIGASIYYGGLAAWVALSSNIHLYHFYGISFSSKAADNGLVIALAVIGYIVFLIGEIGNGYHHYLLAHLRPKGVTGHVIPSGGMFGLLSCPHYFFELVSWVGFMLVSQVSVGSIAFLVLSIVVLIPRSLEKHNKYRAEFDGQKGKALYPKGRKALIPFIL